MKGSIAWTWRWVDWEVALHVPVSIGAILSEHRQGSRENERGGQLFVDVRDERGLYLARATRPHHRDRSGRTWLELDERRCRDELGLAGKAGLHLLGYWHTHPEKIPRISMQDERSFREFTQTNAPTIRYPVCVIVGQKVLRAWSVREGTVIEAEREEFVAQKSAPSAL